MRTIMLICRNKLNSNIATIEKKIVVENLCIKGGETRKCNAIFYLAKEMAII